MVCYVEMLSLSHVQFCWLAPCAPFKLVLCAVSLRAPCAHRAHFASLQPSSTRASFREPRALPRGVPFYNVHFLEEYPVPPSRGWESQNTNYLSNPLPDQFDTFIFSKWINWKSLKVVFIGFMFLAVVQIIKEFSWCSIDLCVRLVFNWFMLLGGVRFMNVFSWCSFHVFIRCSINLCFYPVFN